MGSKNDFLNTPFYHICKGNSMRKCYEKFLPKSKNKLIPTEKWIQKANSVWENKYTYEKAVYTGWAGEIIITCKEHGDFTVPAKLHTLNTRPQGCPACMAFLRKEYADMARKRSAKTTEQFIAQSKEKFGENHFDYSETNYINHHTHVILTCKICGEKLNQSPSSHLLSGCSYCSCSKRVSKGETIINELLKQNNITFKRQHCFEECRNKSKLHFDFYLPQHNIIIEYNGKQHYEIDEHWGGEEKVKYVQELDLIKKEYCEKENINLIIIRYDENLFHKLKFLIA